MRKSNFVFGAFLSLALAVGVGVGLSAHKESKEVKADGASHTVYCAIDNSTLGEYTLQLNVKLNSTLWDRQSMVKLTDDPAHPGASIFTASFNDLFGYIKVLEFELLDNNTSVGKDTVINTESDSDFAFDNKLHVYGQSGWSSEEYTPASPLQYVTVTKLAVEFINDEPQSPADWGLGEDYVLSGSVYSAPAKTTFDMEEFVGWFTDADCTVSFFGSESLTENLTIYAKYNKTLGDSYIYWVSESETPVFTKAYFWGYNESEYHLNLEDYDITGEIKFNRSDIQQRIYKIPVPSQGSINCIFYRGNWDVQTENIEPVTPGAAYFTWKEYENDKYSWDANRDAGAALDLIYSVEAKRNAVTAHGSIKQSSVCGISAPDSRVLYKAYEGLTVSARTMVNDSFVNTYDRSNPSSKNFVSYQAVMEQLGIQAGELSSGRISSLDSLDVASDNTMIIVVSAIAASTAIALGALLILKKRKHN